jgi:DNA-binding transcriptional ArsR family regulator
VDKSDAIASLGALAHGSRLDIFRLLVQAGTDGLPAGQLGIRLGLPAATLSFHLNQLRHAGLIKFRREGRSLIYAAEYAAMNSLVGYLTDNCCQGGGTCSVAAPRVTRVSKGVRNHETHARARRR